MNAGLRERVMKAFCDSKHALISNARRLTEGVDVPAVDMVAFLSPKKSRIDIVQAAGRAMRNSEGKQRGYILVPLFVEQEHNESIEAAVARLNYGEVWEVLRCLQEQDEALHAALAELSENLGKTGEVDYEKIGNISINSETITIEAIKKAVTARLFKPLISPWEYHFGELQRFKNENGHCNVPRSYKKNPQLAVWVGNMRSLGRSNKISDKKRKKLEEIGFSFCSRIS